MENENKKLRELRYKIENLKKRKVKKKVWSLTATEKEFVEELLGKENVVPFIYQITTKSFKNLYNIKSSLIREIHFANKAGKKVIGRSLKKQEMEELEKNRIKYRPIKFIIYLN